ncbi:hypothetical protein LINPERPRIM_LOCUS35408 [Linum perenne]
MIIIKLFLIALLAYRMVSLYRSPT